MNAELFTLSQHFLQRRQQNYRRYFIQHTDLSHRMNIISGARGVGKTTTLVQHLLDYAEGDLYSPKIGYLQADHFLLANHSLYEVAEQFTVNGGEYIAFDEIHKFPNWSAELKSIYDTFTELKIIASGSSALEIHKGSHDLSRRALVFQMQGLSFREYLGLSHHLTLSAYSLAELLTDHEEISAVILRQLKTKGLKVLPQFAQYNQHGYYPYSLALNPAHYAMTLEQNIHTALESDLLAIYPQLTGNSIAKIKQLLIYIAGAVPFTPNWSTIKSIVGVGDSRTLQNYLKYLIDAGLVQAISKASNKLATLETMDKLYLNNPNLLYVLAEAQPNVGSLRETFFLNMLAKDHHVSLPVNGDFLIDRHSLFEVGGRKKDFRQIAGQTDAFIAVDGIEQGSNHRIPLWLFGFLY